MRRELSAAAIFCAIASPALATPIIQIAPGVTITEFGAQAVVSGTLQCTNGDTAYLYANMYQVQGQLVAYAYSPQNSQIGCTGASQNWQMVLFASSVPLKPGPATAYAQVYTNFGENAQTIEQVKVSRGK